MTVAGGYGVMIQVPEAVLQQAVEAFARSQSHLLRVDLARTLGLGDYGISQFLTLSTELVDPVLTLVEPDELDLEFSIKALARIETRLAPLPNGPQPAPPPIIEASLLGRIKVRLAGKSIVVNDRAYLALDLRELRLTRFELGIAHSNFQMSPRLLGVVSALARRWALKALSRDVGLVPVSWTVGTTVPVLGNPVPLQLDYRVVSSHAGQRALALLMKVRNEQTNLVQVSYALARPSDTGIFIDLDLLNAILQIVCRVLEGHVIANPGGIVGRLVVHDAAIRVEPGAFVIDNIEVQSSVMEQVVRTIERTICEAIDPFNWWCKKVVDTIIDWVQLDQIANAHGRFLPYVDGNGALKVDASGISVNLSYPMMVVVFLAVDALLPLGSFVTAVLMVWGKILADRAVTGMIEGQSFGLAIDQPIPGTGLSAKATPREITWPTGTFAMMTSLRLV